MNVTDSVLVEIAKDVDLLMFNSILIIMWLIVIVITIIFRGNK